MGADNPAPIHEMPFLPRDHKLTEALIRASGLEYNIQRDFYTSTTFPTSSLHLGNSAEAAGYLTLAESQLPMSRAKIAAEYQLLSFWAVANQIRSTM